jgi:hypothetical protein
MMYRPLRLCAQGGGYEAVPESPRSLDLPRVRAALESQGIEVVDARVMLVAALPPEVTIARSGRLLFKTADPQEARRALGRLLPLLASPPGAVGRASPTR